MFMQLNRPGETKSVIDLTEALRTHLNGLKFNPYSLDAFAGDYCSDPLLLHSLTTWFTLYYPKLKSQATPESIAYIDNLIEIHKKLSKKDDDEYQNQNVLSDYLAFFCAKHQPGNTPVPLKKIKDSLRAQGHCDGYSYFVGMLFKEMFRSMEPQKSLEHIPNIVNQKLDALFKADKKLGPDEIKLTEAALKKVYYSQHSRNILSQSQGDWHLIHRALEEDDSLNLKYDIVLPFNETNIHMLVNDILLCAHPKEEEKKAAAPLDVKQASEQSPYSVELMPITANNHTSLIIKVTDEKTHETSLFYYDPNNLNGIIFIPEEKKPLLSKIIAAAHRYTPEKSFSLGTHLFGSTKQEFAYPPPETLLALAGKDLVMPTGLAALCCGDTPKAKILNAIDISVRAGSEPSFKFWLKKLGNNKAKLPKGYNFLHRTAKSNRVDMMRFLLDQKPTVGVNDKTPSGRTALHLAARYGFTNCVQLLLERNADIHPKINPKAKKHQQFTPLAIATQYGHPEVVRLLLEANEKKKGGANSIDVQMPDGKTALHIAVEHNRLDIAKMLIDHGANVFAVTQNGRQRPIDLIDREKSREMFDLVNTAMVAKSSEYRRAQTTGLFLAAAASPDDDKSPKPPATFEM